VPQFLAGVPIGAGIQMVFLPELSYIIDVYLIHANSAIAGNALARWLVGGGFLLFATAMYHTFGVPWTTSLLGFLSVVFLPCSILFFLYSARI